ncbi:hypothetical protein [Variovorax sp. IB41]|uniref:hypothetical protein n=1 Tax=Variovorax sp. IB41 TaxID=2779370 RepID=UPI0018E8CB8F|nr:hypothetical protein [Variovorax sp. IB41]MBJ2154591.1 hypothetical protein [Variovorax sp. IB41]
MWKPDKPIVIAGEALTDIEVWWREFGNAFHELCAGEVDEEWLVSITHAIYPLALDHEPRGTAKLVYTALMFEMPEFVEGEHAARARNVRLKAIRAWMSRCNGPWQPR